MKVYKVVARVWSTEDKKVVDKVLGLFEDYVCAKLFRNSYNTRYNANSEIIISEMWEVR